MSIVLNSKVKVLDCTIRDGGLINKWQFPEELVKSVYHSLTKAGIDYMEIGYRASEKLFDPKEYGKWRFSKDDTIKEVIGDQIPDKMKIGVMVDIGRVETDDLLPKDQAIIDFVRVATYVKDTAKAVETANIVEQKGYQSFINIMAISTVNEHDLIKALEQIEKETNVIAVTVVDSYGSLYPDDVKYLVELFRSVLKEKQVGFHGHNNQQLGFANTIQAIQSGATFCDATINGIGRGAGNCPIELLLSWLKNPKYNIEPILQVIQDHFVKLAESGVEWGYIIPYMITGILNEHPRTAIALRDSEQRDHYADFYRKLTTPECFK
ncbi:MAG TPA: aldolase catalytic domain-containing protein [Victivallales bacterium]|nr:aldolase catalytic domain-containing protein [Victivallales bacterium]HPO89941.1 aldolase catalytic domain-containing protein [Victivallales bacterium]HRU01254.1 aldolase catalytic domain-containing protein [Victivallales bacterium]